LNKLALYQECEFDILQNKEFFFVLFIRSLNEIKISLVNLTEIGFFAKKIRPTKNSIYVNNHIYNY